MLTVEEAQIVVYADVLFQIIYLRQVGEYIFFHGKGAVEATLRFIVVSFFHEIGCPVVEVCQQSVCWYFSGVKQDSG